jgi:hypothetical protein
LGIALASEFFDGGLVWTSVDGTGWEALTLGEAFKFGWIVRFARSRERLIGLTAGWEMCCGAIASSSDSQVWSLASFSDSPSAPAGIALLADGQLLVVGLGYATSGPCAEGGGAGATWTSKDVRTWVRSTVDFGCEELTGVAVGPKGVIATGGSAGSWFSNDGKTWIPSESTFGPRGAVPIGVAADGTFLAAGNQAIWESVDGRSWALSTAIPSSLPRMPAVFSGGIAIGCGSQGCEERVIQP